MIADSQTTGAWHSCRIGSCQRHHCCMYVPCRNGDHIPDAGKMVAAPNQTTEPEYDDDRGPTPEYRAWLRVLNEDVIQGEFGYEEGEFTAFPSLWHDLYAEGLSPRQAWQRALDAFKAERDEADHLQYQSTVSA